MARLIRSDRDGPIRIDPQDKPVFICGCGLTGDFPYCDGSHKHCKNEKPGNIYKYDPKTKAIKSQLPDDETS